MPLPLDHVTVIQQINFAERVHQDLQTHPDVTMHKARELHRRTIAETRQRANATETTRRTAIRLHGENYHLTQSSTGGRVDLKA